MVTLHRTECLFCTVLLRSMGKKFHLMTTILHTHVVWLPSLTSLTAFNCPQPNGLTGSQLDKLPSMKARSPGKVILPNSRIRKTWPNSGSTWKTSILLFGWELLVCPPLESYTVPSMKTYQLAHTTWMSTTSTMWVVGAAARNLCWQHRTLSADRTYSWGAPS